MSKAKLSDAQRKMLDRLRTQPAGERTPSGMGRHSGRAAAAWYRTAGSLADMGLVSLVREGDAYRATVRQEAGR